MTFSEYEKQAITTRSYRKEIGIPYCALGLCGELGEFYEKLDSDELIDPKLIQQEVGDMLWYIALLRVELDLPEMEWFDRKPISPNNPFTLVIESGKIAEQIKKYLHGTWETGDESEVPEERKEIISQSLTMILCVLNDLSRSLWDMELPEIAQMNLTKLADRAKRNVIKGEGDVR